jgi:hypothetical protein
MTAPRDQLGSGRPGAEWSAQSAGARARRGGAELQRGLLPWLRSRDGSRAIRMQDALILRRLRQFVSAVLAAGLVGTTVDLLLLNHIEDVKYRD